MSPLLHMRLRPNFFAMSTQKVRRAKKLLDDQGVPDDGMRTMTISAAGMEQLLGDAEASTFDKNVIKALYDGDIKKWVGFNFIQINTRLKQEHSTVLLCDIDRRIRRHDRLTLPRKRLRLADVEILGDADHERAM